MMFAPNRMRNISAEIQREPVKSGLAGVLAVCGGIPLMAMLFFTLVGIPVMLLMMAVRSGGVADGHARARQHAR